MGDIVGGKSQFKNIKVPIGKKIIGNVTEVKLSEKIEGYISISVEFPEYTVQSNDGKKTFTKRGYYGIPVDWSEKNKAGRLYKALTGKFPEMEESVNWTKLLGGIKVACIFEAVVDDQTGEPKGDKICWMGSPNTATEITTPRKNSGIEVHDHELSPDDEIPF